MKSTMRWLARSAWKAVRGGSVDSAQRTPPASRYDHALAGAMLVEGVARAGTVGPAGDRARATPLPRLNASAAAPGTRLLTLLREYPAAVLVAAFNIALAFLTLMAMQGLYRYVVDATLVVMTVAILATAIASIRVTRLDAPTLVGALTVIAAVLMTGLLQHETLLGDYDSGNYAFRAAYLGRTGEFAPMFLPGYTVYLSALFHVGGYGLQQWGNALLLAATLLIVIRLGADLTGNRWAGVIAAALVATHYTTIWFSRQTLSDNMGLFLLSSGMYFLVCGIGRRVPGLALFSLVPVSLMLLSRPEALLFLPAMVGVIAIWWWRSRVGLPAPAALLATTAIVALLVAANVTAVVVHETAHGEEQYYRGYFDKAAHLASQALPGVSTIETARTPAVEDSNPAGLPTYRTYALRFVGESFFKYGLHIIFGVGLLGLLFHRRNIHLVAALLGASSPVLLLIVEPTISWVHPWFMRHYWETLLPLGALLAARWIVSLESSRYAAVASAVLIGANLWLARPIITLQDSAGFHDALAEANTFIADREALVLAEPQLKYVVDPLHYLFDVNPDRPVSFLDDTDPDTVGQLLDEAATTNHPVYLITRHGPTDAFPGIQLADGSTFASDDLEFVGGTILDTRRLVFIASADRYASPESIPPRPLDRGYAPIAEAVDQLPPRTIGRALYRFYVYRVIASGLAE